MDQFYDAEFCSGDEYVETMIQAFLVYLYEYFKSCVGDTGRLLYNHRLRTQLWTLTPHSRWRCHKFTRRVFHEALTNVLTSTARLWIVCNNITVGIRVNSGNTNDYYLEWNDNNSMRTISRSRKQLCTLWNRQTLILKLARMYRNAINILSSELYAIIVDYLLDLIIDDYDDYEYN